MTAGVRPSPQIKVEGIELHLPIYTPHTKMHPVSIATRAPRVPQKQQGYTERTDGAYCGWGPARGCWVSEGTTLTPGYPPVGILPPSIRTPSVEAAAAGLL